MNPKRQHWVPRFYLREFAIPETRDTKNPKVWVFSRRHDDGDPKPIGIANVAAETHLYSPLAPDGTRSFKVEEMLGQVEDLLAPMWGRFANGRVDLDINQGMRRGLAWFIALLLARHPERIAMATHVHEQMLKLYESAPKDDDGNPIVTVIDKSGIPQKVDMSEWTDAVKDSDSHVRRLFAESIHRTTVEFTEDLLAKKWSIVVAPRPVFVTSDRPVYLLHDTRETFGIRTKGTRIVFPISPRHLLLAYDDEMRGETNRYVRLKKDDDLTWNSLTWVNAHRFLISHFEPSEMLATMVHESDKYDRIQENRGRQVPRRIGRNEQCPCGSGVKYKRCCGHAR